jgi:hypothetical protein
MLLAGDSERNGTVARSRRILKGDRQVCEKAVGWVHLAQDRDERWTAMNTVMTLRVP